MLRPTSRRTVLCSLAALAAAVSLAACSDDGEAVTEKVAQATTDPAKPAEPAKPAAAAPKPAGTVDMAKLLEPGPLPDMVLGKPDAPVAIVEYASMTCPHCAHFHATTLPALKEKYIDTGKAKLILREFPFDPRAEAGFMLARCSNDNYFAMVDVLFKQQPSWVAVEDAKSALLQIAKLAGFSQESFEKCLTDQKLLNDVRAVRERGAKDFGVDSTPTFFINGNRYPGAMSIDEMSAIIDGMH
ncbi:MAG: DsbA family protein [Mesorhizobium sp.]|jgi:protein-disulfide isomerase